MQVYGHLSGTIPTQLTLPCPGTVLNKPSARPRSITLAICRQIVRETEEPTRVQTVGQI